MMISLMTIVVMKLACLVMCTCVTGGGEPPCPTADEGNLAPPYISRSPGVPVIKKKNILRFYSGVKCPSSAVRRA